MKKQFKINIKLDFWTVGIALILSIIGILFIYSSSSHQPENQKYLKQILNLFIALIFYFIFANMNYQNFYSRIYFIYILGIVFLILTLIFGTTINNSKSWIKFGFFSVQLSEFAKLTFIISFSFFINNYQHIVKNVLFIIISFLFLLPYLVLLLLQPDVGTAMIFVFIFFVLLFLGGANTIYLGMILGVGIIATFIPFFTYYLLQVSKIDNSFILFLDNSFYLTLVAVIFLLLSGILYLLKRWILVSKHITLIILILLTLGIGFMGVNGIKFLFKEYHYKRFLVFINADLDPAGKGYNIKQSRISIGSGQFTGQGLTKGKQNRGGFLPAEDTDFIIALVGEEWGFLGVSFILFLYIFLIYRCLQVSYSAKDLTASLISAGITAMLMGHIMINIFSSTGLLPVIGVPLPFISYGGSFLLSLFIGLGIIFSIKIRRFTYE